MPCLQFLRFVSSTSPRYLDSLYIGPYQISEKTFISKTLSVLMAFRASSSPFLDTHVQPLSPNNYELPQMCASNDLSFSTTMYDSSSADHAIDDAEICHTIAIVCNDINSFRHSMEIPNTCLPRQSLPNTDSNFLPRAKRLCDNDASHFSPLGPRKQDSFLSHERASQLDQPLKSRSGPRSKRSLRESRHRASIIGDSSDNSDVMLKISTRSKPRSSGKRSPCKNQRLKAFGSKLGAISARSSDDDPLLANSASAFKPKKFSSRSRRQTSPNLSENEIEACQAPPASEVEKSVMEESDSDVERLRPSRKSSRKSRQHLKDVSDLSKRCQSGGKSVASELKVKKSTIVKKPTGTSMRSSQRSLDRKKASKDERTPQLRVLGGKLKEPSKRIRLSDAMIKEKEAIALETARIKSELAKGTPEEVVDETQPLLKPIIDFANSTYSCKFNMKSSKVYHNSANRFTLALIPNCGSFGNIDLMAYLVSTCKVHIETLTNLCTSYSDAPQLEKGLDFVFASEDTWENFASKMWLGSQQSSDLPPFITCTSEAIQFTFKIFEKVTNCDGGMTIETFWRDWYDASLSNFSGQLAWTALELWDILDQKSLVDKKSSKLIDWALSLASIVFLFEMRQLSFFPKKASEESLQLKLYENAKPFDLPTAIQKGLKYISVAGNVNRKGASLFVDLVHSYFTALHCEYRKDDIVTKVWNSVKCPSFATQLAKDDLFWTIVVQSPVSASLNHGRVHEDHSLIAFIVALLQYAPTCRVVFTQNSKSKDGILSLALQILKEMSRDLLSFFETIWDHKNDFRDGITADHLIKIILKFGFSQRELMYSSSGWRSEFLDAIREIVLNTKKLAWIPLTHLAPRFFYEYGPFIAKKLDSLECDSTPFKVLPNSKEYDLRLYGFACLTWLIGSLGVSMEDGSHEISQANTINFLLSRTSARISQQILEMILIVHLHVEKYIYPGTLYSKRSKKTVPPNVEKMDLLSGDERNKFFSVLNMVRLKVRESKGLGLYKFDQENETPVPEQKEEEGGILQCLISQIEDNPYILKAVFNRFVNFEDDPQTMKYLAESLCEDGEQLLARFDSSSEFSTRWVRLNRRNAYVGNARSFLSQGERAVGLSCTCVPGKTQSVSGDVLQLGCSNDMCENRQLKIECGPGPCGAGDTCRNRRLQNMDYAKTRNKKVLEKGVGLFADENIKSGSLIGEYQGEVLSKEDFRSRKHEYRGERHFYFMTLTRNLVIDASRKSQITRFVNHSCDPNCVTEKWNAGGEPRVAIVALRDISRGEEITFDYGAHSIGLDSAPCLCGSSKCRGKLASAKKLSSQRDDKSEEIEEKIVSPRFSDTNADSSESVAEDLQNYVSEKVEAGNRKIERGKKILKKITGMANPFSEITTIVGKQPLTTEQVQRLSKWKSEWSELTKSKEDRQRENDQNKNVDVPQAPPVIKAGDLYRIPRLARNPKSDHGPNQTESHLGNRGPDSSKPKTKASRFSGNNEFFAEYRAKLRALQVPELTADGRPVDINTHYVRGMNPEMAMNALELTLRSESRIGPQKQSKTVPQTHTKGPFMQTRRLLVSKTRKPYGPRRPIFAPRQRTGKYRKMDDSMEEYSTASSAEPIDNYRWPEITNSDEEWSEGQAESTAIDKSNFANDVSVFAEKHHKSSRQVEEVKDHVGLSQSSKTIGSDVPVSPVKKQNHFEYRVDHTRSQPSEVCKNDRSEQGSEYQESHGNRTQADVLSTSEPTTKPLQPGEKRYWQNKGAARNIYVPEPLDCVVQHSEKSILSHVVQGRTGCLHIEDRQEKGVLQTSKDLEEKRSQFERPNTLSPQAKAKTSFNHNSRKTSLLALRSKPIPPSTLIEKKSNDVLSPTYDAKRKSETQHAGQSTIDSLRPEKVSKTSADKEIQPSASTSRIENTNDTEMPASEINKVEKEHNERTESYETTKTPALLSNHEHVSGRDEAPQLKNHVHADFPPPLTSQNEQRQGSTMEEEETHHPRSQSNANPDDGKSLCDDNGVPKVDTVSQNLGNCTENKHSQDKSMPGIERKNTLTRFKDNVHERDFISKYGTSRSPIQNLTRPSNAFQEISTARDYEQDGQRDTHSREYSREDLEFEATRDRKRSRTSNVDRDPHSNVPKGGENLKKWSADRRGDGGTHRIPHSTHEHGNVYGRHTRERGRDSGYRPNLHDSRRDYHTQEPRWEHVSNYDGRPLGIRDLSKLDVLAPNHSEQFVMKSHGFDHQRRIDERRSLGSAPTDASNGTYNAEKALRSNHSGILDSSQVQVLNTELPLKVEGPGHQYRINQSFQHSRGSYGLWTEKPGRRGPGYDRRDSHYRRSNGGDRYDGVRGSEFTRNMSRPMDGPLLDRGGRSGYGRLRSRFSNSARDAALNEPKGARTGAERSVTAGAVPEQLGNSQREKDGERGSKPHDLREIIRSRGNK